MRIRHKLVWTLCFLFFATSITDSTQAEPNDTLPYETIADNNLNSGWWLEEPGLVIVATPDELTTIHHLLLPDDYESIRGIDYDKYFIIAAFHGRWTIELQTPEMRIEEIHKEGAAIQLVASTEVVTLPFDDLLPFETSPYHIVKIEKDDTWGRRYDFALQLNDTAVLTQTHFIPSRDVAFETVIQSSQDDTQDSQQLWPSTAIEGLPITALADISTLESFLTPETLQILQTIDYDQWFVFALFQGLQESTGYGIEIEQIRHEQGEIQIRASVMQPTDDNSVEMRATSPYHIVSVHKEAWWDRELDFVISINGEQTISQTHHIPNSSLAIETLHSGMSEYWQLWQTPGLILINTVQDIPLLDSVTRRSEIDPMSIDYNKYFIAVLFQGLQGSTGYEISLQQAKKEDSRLLLQAHAREPFVGETVGLGSTSPYHIAKIERGGNEWSNEIDVALSFNGTQVLTQTHYIPSNSQIVTLDKNSDYLGWDSLKPHLEILTNEFDVIAIDGLVTPESLAAVRKVDFNEHYVAAIFQGQKPSTSYDIELQQVRRQSDQLVLDSVVTEPTDDEDMRQEVTSPYQLVQIERFYENGREIDFTLSVNGQSILTQTRTITDPYHFITIDKQDGQSGWDEIAPNFMIVATPNEIESLSHLVSAESIERLYGVDYDKYYTIAAFQGMHPSSGYDMTIHRLSRQGQELAIHTTSRSPLEPEEQIETSPYHLIQVNREHENGYEVEFALVVNSVKVLTRSHAIPDISQIYLPFVGKQ